MYRTLIVLAFSLFPVKLYCQARKTGTIAVATIVLPTNMEHRFGGFFEAQLRTNEVFFSKPFYTEFKAGAGYALSANASVLLGAGRYTTYNINDFGQDPLSTENRVWEQLVFTQQLSRIKFEHRYRVEQRWVNRVYRNRLRYRLNATVPLNNATVVPRTVFFSIYDEIFLNNRQPNFERNRASASLGYVFSPAVTLQAGWVNNYNYSLAGSNDKNNMMISVSYQIVRKKQKVHVPK
jgi:hypothetical protein